MDTASERLAVRRTRWIWYRPGSRGGGEVEVQVAELVGGAVWGGLLPAENEWLWAAGEAEELADAADDAHPFFLNRDLV